MKRRSVEPISSLLSQFLRQEGLETQLAEYRAIKAWPDVVGETMARATDSVIVRGQTMIVRLTSPLVRHELLLRRADLLQQLNKAAGSTILYELKLV